MATTIPNASFPIVERDLEFSNEVLGLFLAYSNVECMLSFMFLIIYAFIEDLFALSVQSLANILGSLIVCIIKLTKFVLNTIDDNCSPTTLMNLFKKG